MGASPHSWAERGELVAPCWQSRGWQVDCFVFVEPVISNHVVRHTGHAEAMSSHAMFTMLSTRGEQTMLLPGPIDLLPLPPTPALASSDALPAQPLADAGAEPASLQPPAKQRAGETDEDGRELAPAEQQLEQQQQLQQHPAAQKTSATQAAAPTTPAADAGRALGNVDDCRRRRSGARKL